MELYIVEEFYVLLLMLLRIEVLMLTKVFFLVLPSMPKMEIVGKGRLFLQWNNCCFVIDVKNASKTIAN